ncbi:MAG: hypothetical protein JSS63_02405 [Bacteroidetes bacterium]|nr:hypothetical protein [Bacteroidota bacterium]
MATTGDTKITDILKVVDSGTGALNKFNTVLNDVGDQSDATSKKISNLKTAVDGLSAVSGFIQFAAVATETLGPVGGVTAVVLGLTYALYELGKQNEETMDDMEAKTKKTSPLLIGMSKEVEILKNLLNETTKSTGKSKDEQDKYNAKLKEASKYFPEIITGIDKETGAISTNKEAIERAINSREKYLGSWSDGEELRIIDSFTKLSEQFNSQNEAFERGKVSLDEIKKSYEENTGKLARLNDEQEKLNVAFWDAMANAPEQLQQIGLQLSWNSQQISAVNVDLRHEKEAVDRLTRSNSDQATGLVELEQKMQRLIETGLKTGSLIPINRNLLEGLLNNKTGADLFIKALQQIGPTGAASLMGFGDALSKNKNTLAEWVKVYHSIVEAIKNGNIDLALKAFNDMKSFVDKVKNTQLNDDSKDDKKDKKPRSFGYSGSKNTMANSIKEDPFEKAIATIEREITIAEKKFEQGRIDKKQKDEALQLSLEELRASEKLIAATKENANEKEKELEIEEKKVKYYEKEIDLLHKLGKLTEKEEQDLKANLNKKAFEKIENTPYRSVVLSKTPEQIEEENQKKERGKKEKEDKERNEIISSDEYKAASSLLNSLGDVLKGSLSDAWEGAFGEANSLFEQFMQKIITSIATNLINSGINALLGAIFPGAGLAGSFLGSLFNQGGLVALADGGNVPGVGDTDSVPAMLTPGEFVIRKSVVSKIGAGFFEKLNGGSLFTGNLSGYYAEGGSVSSLANNVKPASPVVNTIREPYIVSTSVRGTDLKLTLQRTDQRLKNIKV